MKQYQKPIVIINEILIDDVILSSIPIEDENVFGEGDGEIW